MKKKLVIATDNRFWRKSLGSQQRISSLIGYLEKQNIDITIFFLGKYYENDYELAKKTGYKIYTSDQYEIINKTTFLFKKVFLSLIYRVKKLIKRTLAFFLNADNAPTLDDYINLKEKEAFKQLITDLKPDSVLVEYIRLAYLIDNKKTQIPSLFLDTHDVSFLRHKSYIQSGQNSDLKISKGGETKILNRFDHILAIQLEDQQVFRQMCNKNIIHTPHAIPVNDSPPIEGAGCQRLDIGFIGSSMTPNVDGINQFISSVLNKTENVYLHIFGSLCGKLATDNSNVKLHGYIDNLDSAYKQCHVMINPVFFGGGLKIKSVEALAYKKPLISTIEGVRGMPSSDAFIICDSPEEWSKAINQLKSFNFRELMSKKASLYITEHYSDQAAYGPFISELLKA